MKNTFLKSTIILIIGGFITKLLGLIIKIALTRYIGTTGIGLYSLILPSFLLCINLANLGLPTALNVLISSNKYNNKNLLFTSIIISLTIDFIILITLLIFSSYISNNILNNTKLTLGLISIGLVLPFITISNALRSWFFAKEKMYSHVLTNIIEDIVKFLLIILVLPKLLNKGLEICIAFIILTNILTESSSIFIFLILMPKFNCKLKELKPNSNNIKELFKLAIPTTLSRLIGTIGYFLEPIIIMNVLLKLGYNELFITNEYGIINGYVMQLVLLPSFFTGAISQALIPVISKNYVLNNKKYIKKKIKQAIIISLMIGIPSTIIFELYPSYMLKLFFNTTKGIKYIKVFAPICLFHYIQSPISSALQAMKKAKYAAIGTFLGILLRTISLYLFSLLNIGLWPIIIATSINMIFVTIFDYLCVKKHLS